MTDGYSAEERWCFEDIETSLRSFAEGRGFRYDESHPLSCLPPDAAKNALDQLGSSYSELADYSHFGYKTVAGWFSLKRKLFRSTVVNGLYPALCEAYLRHHVDLDDDAVSKTVARRVFYLLTTGSDITPEEHQKDLDLAQERFHRAALSYAAQILSKSDLSSIAHSALGFLALNHGGGEASFDWSVEGEEKRILLQLVTEDELNSASALNDASSIMERETWHSRLASTSLDELQECSRDISEAIQLRM